ncbi:MAG: glycoside hydrolase [Chitinophagaceae bacterium]|nr:glycoside hydrolase [Chitinophagaceae bacterium]
MIARYFKWSVAIASFFPVCFAVAQENSFVFKNGESGYNCFRIPAIVKTTKGNLLAFAEGRKKGCGDTGYIDLVLKRSADGGKTWGNLQVVWTDSGNTCGNPAPVVDKQSGDIILLSTWNLGEDEEWEIIAGKSKSSRRIFVIRSANEGLNWTAPVEITSNVKNDNWTWYATGPVNGIQLNDARFKNRLIIPCDHIEAGSKKYFSHVIYSDDGGYNWKLGGTTPTDLVNECTVAELPNGRLLLNMRNYGNQRVRQTALSLDGGLSWSALQPDSALIEPVCQASLLGFYYKKQFILAFSNPADAKIRKQLTLKLSYNAGKTWLFEQILHSGPAAYSNLCRVNKNTLGCLYEGGNTNPYEGIMWQTVDLKKLHK